MVIRAFIAAVAAALLCLGSVAYATASASASAPIQVMVLGVHHFDSPGLDLYDAEADDVQVPRRQAELARPTRVMVESGARSDGLTVAKYRPFTPADLLASRDETVQIGFRLARAARPPAAAFRA